MLFNVSTVAETAGAGRVGRAGAPVGQHREEVVDVDDAVPVEVGRAAGIRVPLGQDREKLFDPDLVVAVEIV